METFFHKVIIPWVSRHYDFMGGPCGRLGKVAVFQCSYSFDHLAAVSSEGSSPALATCETSQVLLVGVSGGFPGLLPFCPTHRLARLYERNNLERDIRLNKIKKIIILCRNI